MLEKRTKLIKNMLEKRTKRLVVVDKITYFPIYMIGFIQKTQIQNWVYKVDLTSIQ